MFRHFYLLIIVHTRVMSQNYSQTHPPPTVPTKRLGYETKPQAADWAWNFLPSEKTQLLNWLLVGCVKPEESCTKALPNHIRPTEYEGYDGFYNNLAHPELGAVDTPLLRRVPAAYEDGVYKPSGHNRPKPLELSRLLEGPLKATQSKTGKTALLVFFGQQVVEEILDAQRAACPPEYFNIHIPKDHAYRKRLNHTMMPVLRTRYDARTGFSPNNPRQQLNEITPWLDGGLVYGTTKTWSDQLRTYKNGTIDPNGLLASSEDGLFPEYNTVGLPMANPPPPAHHHKIVERHQLDPVHRFFKLGNPRGNENAFLLSFGVLWFRWHNHIARQLKVLHPGWGGEKIYNEARKWVIATHQHIVVNDWLPKLLGEKLSGYTGYNPAIDPQIDQFFQAAAFRFGHTLVTRGVYLRDYGRNGCRSTVPHGWNGTAVRTCNIFWRPQDAIQAKYNNDSEEFMDIDRLLMGMAFQLSEKEDHKIVEDLRGNVFGPLEFSRRDLMALNIQRGRDHGLPDYNTVREAFGLKRVKDWADFPDTIEQEVKDLFNQLHNKSFEDVDLWVGGILETKDGPGELFTTIIKDQFERIRDGDRFWYKNTANNLFTDEEIQRIEQLTIYDIIMSVTKMAHDDIQEDPFTAVTNLNKNINVNCSQQLSKNSTCKINNSMVSCYHLEPLTSDNLEECTLPETYDYFEGSEISFIVTFLGVGLIVLAFVAALVLLRLQKQNYRGKKITRMESKVRQSYKKSNALLTPFAAQEWVGPKIPLRPVVVVFDAGQRQMKVLTQSGQLQRALDLSHRDHHTQVFNVTDGLHVVIRTTNDYDLVLKFCSAFLRSSFLQAFEKYVAEVGIRRENITMPLQATLKQAITQKDRQKKLEMFFRVVFAQAFGIPHSEDEILNTDQNTSKEIIYTEITKTEFADALSMKRDSEFVEKMFALVDKDQNGFVSFREFLDMLVIFAKGSPDDKAQLMFDMYDINKTRQLTKTDFKHMIRSLIETVSTDVKEGDLNNIVEDMMTQAGLQHKAKIGVSDFQRLLADYKDKLNYTHLNFTGVPGQPASVNTRTSFVAKAQETFSNLYRQPGDATEGTQDSEPTTTLEQQKTPPNTKNLSATPSKRLAIQRLIENYSLTIFWLTLYTLVVLAIFAERAYYYSVEREHSGLRRIAGYGVTVTRGAASAMMFTYSTLLLTMCRSTITLLRDTFLHLYIPFDLAISAHKYIAVLALLFTVIHVVGHAFNFYSISTQTADDLTCLFRNFYHASHELPKFSYWCWETITGVTGILLTLLTALIFTFSLPVARRELYNAFWIIHSLYPVFYILMVLHGAGRLIQEPFFYYFFLGPCVMFTVDHMITASRKMVEVPVVNAELLPSNVTMLEFKKPFNFEYKSGQWIRISCPTLNTLEYHPFTLSSAPHQPTLTVHIRAVGPWTTNIRQKYDPTLLREKPLPKIRIEGPFGEGHQDWYQFEVAVLVGGGIGVTPFASILKDIVNRVNTNQHTACKKVYFIWVTKTQKQFEWLVDIIREIERHDHKKVVSVHIFITQFYQKYDLRTIMLYICERHFQRICNRSLLTGLQAQTDFGRPNFTVILSSVQSAHRKVGKIGVFSCGPPSLTQIVDVSCISLNKKTVRGPLFQHHFKNF
ncbi:dual oxidase-like isoform X2 [Bacillus rossius redtenbacheri]|uniref:dual oxidase-like isoform X2 n=1 Tax=Bacillus rossius redtenbacheri TaxID=93214 RepID=UPI002FDCDAA7